jgi:hypothetical protein
MTLFEGKPVWAEVSYQHALTTRTIHTVAPCFRTFRPSGEQTFQLPLETCSHGGQCVRTAWETSEPCVFNVFCNAPRVL